MRANLAAQRNNLLESRSEAARVAALVPVSQIPCLICSGKFSAPSDLAIGETNVEYGRLARIMLARGQVAQLVERGAENA